MAAASSARLQIDTDQRAELGCPGNRLKRRRIRIRLRIFVNYGAMRAAKVVLGQTDSPYRVARCSISATQISSVLLSRWL